MTLKGVLLLAADQTTLMLSAIYMAPAKSLDWRQSNMK